MAGCDSLQERRNNAKAKQFLLYYVLVLRFGPVIRVIRPSASVVTGGCISRNDSSHKKMDSEHEEHEELSDELEERVVGDFFQIERITQRKMSLMP